MNCPKCQNQMVVSDNGVLICPSCTNIKKEVVLYPITYKDFEAYKVVKAFNILVDEFLLKEEVQKLINQGVKVRIE